MCLIDTFETHRPLLFATAYRMLGSAAEAEDIVQETFLRFQAAAAQDIRSPRAYLCTIVTRLCLDALNLARTSRECYLGVWSVNCDSFSARLTTLLLIASLQYIFLRRTRRASMAMCDTRLRESVRSEWRYDILSAAQNFMLRAGQHENVDQVRVPLLYYIHHPLAR